MFILCLIYLSGDRFYLTLRISLALFDLLDLFFDIPSRLLFLLNILLSLRNQLISLLLNLPRESL